MLFASVVALALSPSAADAFVRHTVEMRFRVTDAAGQPLPGAAIHVSVWSKLDLPNRDFVTGPDGVAAVRRPKALDILRVWASKPGYAGVFRGWEQGASAGGAGLPAAFTLPLQKATTIGGRILDGTGKGVAGVRIAVECTVPPAALPDGVHFNTFLADGSSSGVVTDADGRWTLRNVPAPATTFSLRVTHPDYVSDTRYGELQAQHGVTAARLRAGHAVVRLEPGAKVTGTVSDAAGKPVSGAVLVFHDDPFMTPGSQEVQTDAKGAYTLPTLRPGRHPITVVARGHRPERRDVNLAAGPRVEDFRLAAGVPLRVKVVDEAGQPVPRVTFAIESWRGSQAMRNTVDTQVLAARIPNVSKPDGVYHWPWAPADAVRFELIARGFQRQNVDLTAGAGEQRLVLRKTPVVAGKLTDARTGKPVTGVRVTPVIDFGRDLYAVERNRGIDAGVGAYRLELERSDCDYRLLIEAPGYRTALSRSGLLKDRVTTADFPLDPAPPVAGRVLDAAGNPVKGARVSLATSVQDLRFPDRSNSNLSAMTDETGEFRLPAQAERFALVVEHPAGTVRVDRNPDEPAGDLTLRPWASVSGVLWQDGKPVSGQRVLLQPRGRVELGTGPRVEVDFQMLTDDGGAFRFDRVPAGPLTLWPSLGPWQVSPLTGAEVIPLDPKPGDRVRLDLGKLGATVHGRFTLAGDPPPGLTFELSLNSLVRRAPDTTTPGVTAPAGIDLTKAWDSKRMDGDPAARDMLVNHRRFSVKPTPAGEFRVGGVPAGDYWLTVKLYEKTDGGCLVSPCGVAAVPMTVTPAQAAGGESVTVPPVDVPVRRGLQAGDRLPELALLDPAGKPVDLAGLKGRAVLLHGWAGWCTACPRDYAGIRKLRADVPADMLAVVGLNLDADAATAGRLAAKYEFPWPQACLGTPSGEPAADRLGVGSVPLYVVLDPAGVVKYRGADWAAADRVARDATGK